MYPHLTRFRSSCTRLVCITVLLSAMTVSASPRLKHPLLDRNNMPVPKSIVTLDVAIAKLGWKFDFEDYLASTRVLQGLMNRISAKKIYLFNDNGYCSWTGPNNWPLQEEMLKTFPETKDLPRSSLAGGNPKTAFKSLMEYTVKNHAGLIKGQVIWDPKIAGSVRLASSGAAITIAAQKNWLAVSPRVSEQLKAWGYDIPVRMDLRDNKFTSDWQVVNWQVENYFESSNRKHEVVFSHGCFGKGDKVDSVFQSGPIDYAVATNGFLFSLFAQDADDDKALFNLMSKLVNGRGGVIGWIPTMKGEVPKLSAERSAYYGIGTSIASNFSVLGAFPDSDVDLPEPKAHKVENNDVFITWWIQDGDNLAHAYKGQFGNFKRSKSFGQAACTWSMTPFLAHIAPPLYTWYCSVMPKDNDMAVIWADRWDVMPCTGLEQYGYTLRDFAKLADLPVVDNFAKNNGTRGDIVDWAGTIAGIGKNSRREQKMDAAHPDGALLGLHCYQAKVHMNPGEVPAVADSIRAWAASHKGPIFMPHVIGKQSYYKDWWQIAKAIQDNLLAKPEGRSYHFVSARDMMVTYTTWKGRKWDWNHEIIQVFIDNREQGFTKNGSWGNGFSWGGYGPEYLTAKSGSGAWAQCKPSIPQAGKYEISLWSVGGVGSSSTRVAVHRAGGIDSLNVNMRQNAGGWVKVGSFDLDNDSRLRILANGSSGTIAFDAARFLLLDAPKKSCDLRVTDLSWKPAKPSVGDEVTFSATITNAGESPTPAGTVHGIAFMVDTVKVAWSDTMKASLAPGKSITLTANGGPNGSAAWKAVSGKRTLSAIVDDVNRISESDENNNRLQKELNIGTTPARFGATVARMRPATIRIGAMRIALPRHTESARLIGADGAVIATITNPEAGSIHTIAETAAGMLILRCTGSSTSVRRLINPRTER